MKMIFFYSNTCTGGGRVDGRSWRSVRHPSGPLDSSVRLTFILPILRVYLSYIYV